MLNCLATASQEGCHIYYESAEFFWDQTLFCKNLKFHCHTPFLKTNIKPQLPVVNPWWRRMKKAVMWGQQCLLSRAVYPHQSCCCHMSPVLTPQKILSATFTQILGKVTRLRLYQRKIWIHLNRTCFYISFATSTPSQASCHMSPIPTPPLQQR